MIKLGNNLIAKLGERYDDHPAFDIGHILACSDGTLVNKKLVNGLTQEIRDVEIALRRSIYEARA